MYVLACTRACVRELVTRSAGMCVCLCVYVCACVRACACDYVRVRACMWCGVLCARICV